MLKQFPIQQPVMLLLICCYCFTAVLSFTPAVSCSTKRLSSALLLKSNDNDNVNSNNRRALTFGSLLTTSTILSKSTTPAANAFGGKSRTQGYDTQHSEKEWSDQLSPDQYFIRNGGTEAPYSSILEGEERDGTYVCAGCSTPLFDASQKFHSGTGWPSYAKPIGNNVEMENMSQIQYKLAGAEVRCSTCGGHLGDVFADGFLFPGTAAFVTGQRYCIDGAALVFQPKDDGGDEVRGDLPPKNGGKPVFYG